MLPMLRAIRKLIDRFLETLLTVVMAILVLDVLWQVFTRYMNKVFPEHIKPSYWTDELATYLMIWVGMLGASVALYRGAHLGIDYFVGKLSSRIRLMTEVAVFAVIALFAGGVMVYGGYILFSDTLEWGQVTPALGIKKGYVYLAVPLSGVFLVIYSVEFLVEKIIALVKHRPDGVHPGTPMTQAAD